MINQFVDAPARQALIQLNLDVTQAQQVGAVCPAGSSTACMGGWVDRFARIVATLQQRYLHLVSRLGESSVRQLTPSLDLALRNLAVNVATYQQMYRSMLDEQQRTRMLAKAK